MLNENLKLLTIEEIELISGGVYYSHYPELRCAPCLETMCEPCPQCAPCIETKIMCEPCPQQKPLTACDFFASLGIRNTTVTITAGQKSLTYHC
jgi:hypothetical protein